MIDVMMQTPPTTSGSDMSAVSSAAEAFTSSAIDTMVRPSVTT